MTQNGRKERLKEILKREFTDSQAEVLAAVIAEAYDEVVKVSDFNELKSIVKELAEAQRRTEERLEELAEAQRRTEERLEELAEAQRRTEERVNSLALRLEELAEAQRKTEERLLRLEEVVEKLALGIDSVRRDLGGLSRTMSYAFENEAFRMLPAFLKREYNIEVKERFIREEIRGYEINIFGKGIKDGKEVYIVGESKLRLDERRDEGIEEIMEDLEDKVRAVKKEYGDVEVIRLLITHYATKGFLREAKRRGIIVVQSFEW